MKIEEEKDQLQQGWDKRTVKCKPTNTNSITEREDDTIVGINGRGQAGSFQVQLGVKRFGILQSHKEQ